MSKLIWFLFPSLLFAATNQQIIRGTAPIVYSNGAISFQPGNTTWSQISTPQNPSAGFDSIYFKSDNNLYFLNSSGVETKITNNGGSGSVTSVGLTMPLQFSVSNSPVTTTGNLQASWNTETANTLLAGPTSGLAGTPAFRALVTADIPNLDAAKVTTGTFSSGLIPALPASQITTGQLALANGGTGQASAANAFNALSPLATLGDTLYAGNAGASVLQGNTTGTKKFFTQTGTGTVSAAPAWSSITGADLPNPSASTLGGIESYTSVSHQWINSISTSGVPSSTQPAFTDVSGTLASSQLPTPGASTLGGVESYASVSHQWINSISTLGVPSSTQPAFTDVSGTVGASQLPNPSASTLGGVQSAAAVSHQWINSISTLGVPVLSQPAFTDVSGSLGISQINATGTPSASTFLRGDGAWAAVGGGITALTGDVTASGTGSVAATLAATSNATLTTLSGLTTASSLVTVGTIGTGTWAGTTIATSHGGTGVTSVTTTPAASSFAGWDANSNLSANSHLDGYATTVTAAGTTTLLVGSAKTQYFTGTTTQTVKLPVTSTLALGQQFVIVNRSTGVVTVQSSGANSIQAMASNTQLVATVILTSGTTAASWDATYYDQSPLAITTNLLCATDGGCDLGGPYPTTANRFAHIWGSTAVIAGSSGNTYLYESTLHLASANILTYAASQLQYQIGGTTYLFVESANTLDYGSITIGGSVNGTTAGYVTQNYSVPVATQSHATTALSPQLDLSTGFSFPHAGQPALVSNGVIDLSADAANNVLLGTGVLATTATNPFPYLPTMAGQPTGTPASTNYAFFITTGAGTNPVTGATYTNNGATFTLLSSVTLATTGMYMVCTGTGAPSASGTLTKSAGTGAATLAYSSVTTSTISGLAPEVLDTTNGKIWFYYGGAWHFVTLTYNDLGIPSRFTPWEEFEEVPLSACA